MVYLKKSQHFKYLVSKNVKHLSEKMYLNQSQLKCMFVKCNFDLIENLLNICYMCTELVFDPQKLTSWDSILA